jgi:hypothetical protein
MSAAIDTDINEAAARLQDRARQLRRQATAAHPVLAGTYRRRAAELDLQALLEVVWNPPMDLSEFADPYAA